MRYQITVYFRDGTQHVYSFGNESSARFAMSALHEAMHVIRIEIAEWCGAGRVRALPV